MWPKKSTVLKINPQTNTAIEAFRQALEVLFGYEIRLVSCTEIEVGKVTEIFEDSPTYPTQTCWVTITSNDVDSRIKSQNKNPGATVTAIGHVQVKCTNIKAWYPAKCLLSLRNTLGASDNTKCEAVWVDKDLDPEVRITIQWSGLGSPFTKDLSCTGYGAHMRRVDSYDGVEIEVPASGESPK